MTELTIKDLFGILRKWLAVLIIVPILAAVAIGVYYYNYTQNEYTAEAKLYVLVDYTDSTGNMRYDMATGAQFAGDYQQLIKTHEVLSAAASMLGVESLEEGDYEIAVDSVTNTRVLNLKVTTKDPELSTRTANTIAGVFVGYMRQMTHTDSVSIASAAELPKEPSGPQRMRNTAMAFAVALMLCCGLALAVELLNTTIRTDKEAEAELGLPVLAQIGGYRKEMQAYLRSKAKPRPPLLHAVSMMTQEGVKTLVMNLRFATMDKNLQTLAVTSATPAEGKSSVAIMMATTLAEEGNQVLLIDMDFRNPSLGMYLGVRNRLDIVDYISKNAQLNNIVTRTQIKGVSLIDSCHKSAIATDVIQTNAFASLLEEAERHYDYVILDTPPMGMFVDAALLTTVVDGVLLVVASGRVERELAKGVVEQLQKAKANTLGIALNFVDKHGSSGFYGYRNSRYFKRYYKRVAS